MDSAGAGPSFSWKRAALHVALAGALVVVAGVVAVAVLQLDDAEQVGQETGRLLIPGLLLILIASYMAQARRRVYTGLFGAVAFAALAGAVAMPVLQRTRTRVIAMTDAERAPLEVVEIGGVEHFRHPVFRFSFVKPPRFERSLEAEVAVRAAVPEHPAAYIYPLAAGDAEDAMLLLVIEKWNRVDRERLEQLVDGLSGVSGGGRPGERRIVWEPSFRGAELHYTVGDGDHVRVAAWVDGFGAPNHELIVALVGLSRGRDAFAEVAPSFRYR